MPLTVRIKKKSNGEAALSCARDDGTVTWQRQEGQAGRFFPLHDLTHFAVESVLHFDSAFFGSIASGWDISDFAGAGAVARLDEQALLAEMLVGFFDLERRTGDLWDASEFNAQLVSSRADRGMAPTSFRITDEQIAVVRAKRAALFAAWNSTPAGEALVLSFE